MRWVSEPAAQRQRDWINRRQFRFSQNWKHQQQTHSLFITNNVISDENIDQYIAMCRLNGIVDSH